MTFQKGLKLLCRQTISEINIMRSNESYRQFFPRRLPELFINLLMYKTYKIEILIVFFCFSIQVTFIFRKNLVLNIIITVFVPGFNLTTRAFIKISVIFFLSKSHCNPLLQKKVFKRTKIASSITIGLYLFSIFFFQKTKTPRYF